MYDVCLGPLAEMALLVLDHTPVAQHGGLDRGGGGGGGGGGGSSNAISLGGGIDGRRCMQLWRWRFAPAR